eukprot:CAMPEP_0118709320 /NCGR_PEP_ID=MMETSP0800-20121206/22555_1 /TAXON_ID=210618 ORGANISM="Striatella unipunctata, Strain CCMP2910" /NCGR_SAMPLE_ID=MMETSP0800 /ASSEMBLY_ACC=CAM_ASM_000638 /LENGTH=135 /DNA_ID=CAMNT_0006612967 /DNA_START=3 /DNA_END=410 /DNA_ORIENTATION=+
MTEQGDGVLEEVHRIRQLVKADVVVMIADDSTGKLCGNAYLGPNKSRMFSVTNWQCATGYFTFGHEIAQTIEEHKKPAIKQIANTDGVIPMLGFDPSWERTVNRINAPVAKEVDVPAYNDFRVLFPSTMAIAWEI